MSSHLCNPICKPLNWKDFSIVGGATPGAFMWFPLLWKLFPLSVFRNSCLIWSLATLMLPKTWGGERKKVSQLLGTKKPRWGELFLETCTTQAGNHIPSMKKCKYTLLVMDGNVPLSLREEELKIQRSQQREKEVLVLGCLATGYLPKNHHPSWLWDACWCCSLLLPLLL